LREAILKLFRLVRGFPNAIRATADSRRDRPTAVRAAFCEYSDSQRQFMTVADTCSHRGWPDRGAVLYNTWQCQRLYIRRQELRFEHLWPRGEFESGVWSSLTRICERLDKNWSDLDEQSALDDNPAYRDLTVAIAEAEHSRASMDKDLLIGPMRTMQGYAEYRAARQAIYEKVHELNRRLGGGGE
jgi:hypothetical protein